MGTSLALVPMRRIMRDHGEPASSPNNGCRTMRTVTVLRGKRYELVSYGNGLAYSLSACLSGGDPAGQDV